MVWIEFSGNGILNHEVGTFSNADNQILREQNVNKRFTLVLKLLQKVDWKLWVLLWKLPML